MSPHTQVAGTERRVLDFHVRLAPVPRAPDRLLATMDECGIGRAVVCAGGTMPLAQLSRFLVEGGHIESDADNDAVLRACEASDGRLIPFFFANPHRDPEHYRKAAPDFRGMEISPAVHGVALTDPRTAGLVEAARDFGHSVYTVCLERDGSRVADLVSLALRYPEVTFVLGHAGIGNIDLYAVELIAPLPNVLLETSGGYTCVARAAVEQLGADRVLFGSEAPLQHPEVELTKLRHLGLGDEDWQKIAWRNACRLLGQEETE
ncbi:amidohydrolase family protein [Streptomyces sp. NBC_00335]|uniref:amidohydrolase family protein n=1 Tax=unclassified Streptomyces TaxID=2593676 RepID=UPI00225177BE|nr:MULTISPECIES: amidohydrolase family protein [unclassified Streptomyces]MCX5405571.1 amidohydrolase family protein [Streptomyces sp. NBC_00086]